MRAFDSIRMGYRCKGWSFESDVPSAYTTVISRGPGYRDAQWIVNAESGDRAVQVKRESADVLDGGPRWVLSTALGFFTGSIWGTVILVLLFALGNYTLYVNTASASSSLTSGVEKAGVVAYMILATTISMASIPGVWRVGDIFCRERIGDGLLVETLLCLSVVLSTGIVHRFFHPFLKDTAGLAMYADMGRWFIPSVVWMAASKLRQKATNMVEKKLRSSWCLHPSTNPISQGHDKLWDDWSNHVEECASRVGGFSMLGFEASDLEKLRSSWPSENALKVITKLGDSIGVTNDPTEPWVWQSLAFLVGYDDRLRHGCPEGAESTIPLKEVKRVMNDLFSGRHDKIDAFQAQIDDVPGHRQKYQVAENENSKFYYAGALVADSDQREEKTKHGEHGSRLAVSLALFAEGTDPLARLECLAQGKAAGSGVQTLRKAISSSTKSLVAGLAQSALVSINGSPLGDRGVAYARGPAGFEQLAYSPDEMTAASHVDEAIVISDSTFTANTSREVFETLWQGSERVEKRVDVSHMLPSKGSASELGSSACRGWMCHVGFTLAILTAHLFHQGSTAVVVLLLISIPASTKEVSKHMQTHYNMVYISCILNYVRFANRGFSLSRRGQASVDKANRVQYVVFLFVNVLPAVACANWSGWKWWVAFVPCLVANVPGLFNALWYRWDSAFEYKWWSWHIINRWYSGRSYLQIKHLRRRVGRNVLSVNVTANSPPSFVVKKVLPRRGSGVRYMVIGGR